MANMNAEVMFPKLWRAAKISDEISIENNIGKFNFKRFKNTPLNTNSSKRGDMIITESVADRMLFESRPLLIKGKIPDK